MLYTTFTVKDIDYKCRLSAKACVDLEKKLGTNPLNVFMEIANTGKVPELSILIAIMHASLTQYNHGITIDKVYEIYDDFIDEGNTMMDLVPVIMETFKVSGFFKEEVEEKKLTGEGEGDSTKEPPSLEKVFNDILLPNALAAGISYFDYWNMTYGEITFHIKQYKARRELQAKEQLATNYNLAALTAQFTIGLLNGNPIPDISTVFPTQFQQEKDQNGLTKEDRMRMDMYKEQFIDFANRRNKLFKKEGENECRSKN